MYRLRLKVSHNWTGTSLPWILLSKSRQRQYLSCEAMEVPKIQSMDRERNAGYWFYSPKVSEPMTSCLAQILEIKVTSSAIIWNREQHCCTHRIWWSTSSKTFTYNTVCISLGHYVRYRLFYMLLTTSIKQIDVMVYNFLFLFSLCSWFF